MKKVFLILMLLVSAVTYSQSTSRITISRYLRYYRNQWHTENTVYPDGLYVTLNKNSITINNDASTSIMTYGEGEKQVFSEHISYSWKAIDKDGDRCTFIMKTDRYNNGLTVSIFYLDRLEGYEYCIEK